MGPEAYGLIAFFSLLQSWFLLLDIGISPTLAREVARYRAGAFSALALRQLLRATEALFWSIGIVAALGMILLSEVIARRWLNADRLPVEQVAMALRVMSANMLFRFISSMYRSAVSGFEAQVWLNGLAIGATTARTFLMIPLFRIMHVDVVGFAVYQLCVSAAETAVLQAKVQQLFPKLAQRLAWSLRPVWSILPFSASVAFSALVWVLVTQTDKLVLSKILSLREFGTLTFAILAASLINLVSAPVSSALLPRIAKLAAEGDEAGLLTVYRRATRWVCVVAAPTTLALVIYAKPILWAWTGNVEVAEVAEPVLRLYAIGNGLLAIAAFQYYLQYAHGNLRLHVAGNLGFVCVLVPALVWAAARWRGVGAGYVWMVQCAFFAIVWTGVVHRRFAPGLHLQWLFEDVAPTWFAVVLVAGVLFCLPVGDSHSRWVTIVELGGCSALLFIAAAISNRDLWAALQGYRRTRSKRRVPSC
jgi:O-antigen/teichoic acid export membrane protein